MQITIYTKSNCPYCAGAKRLLNSKGLEYTEIKVDANAATQWSFFSEYPEVKQMPFIMIDGQRVGGFAGLQAALTQVGL